MRTGGHIRVQAVVQFVSVPHLLFALHFHSDLPFGDPLTDTEGVHGGWEWVQHHTLQMNKLSPRDAEQLLQVHTPEQD